MYSRRKTKYPDSMASLGLSRTVDNRYKEKYSYAYLVKRWVGMKKSVDTKH
jgi:hypothetical protein